MKTPRTLTVAITSSCNQNCAYCCFRESPAERDVDLATDEWLSFFAELRRSSVLRVRLVGGEPLCRADLPDLIDGVVRNGMRFSILTNGTLITTELARQIAQTGRCDSVGVSLDGCRAQTHDAYRGKGTFDRAVRGIDRLLEQDIPVTGLFTLHPWNVSELTQTVEFLLRDLNVQSMSVEILRSLGTCQTNVQMRPLSASELSRAMHALSALHAQYGQRIAQDAGLPARMHRWRTMCGLCLDEAEPPYPYVAHRHTPGRLAVCGVCLSALTVLSDGVYIPCMFLGHMALGRMGRASLEEAWHHPELQRLRDRDAIALASFPECLGCAYIDVCTGGCPAIAYAEAGEDTRPERDSCLRRFLDAGGVLPQEEQAVDRM